METLAPLNPCKLYEKDCTKGNTNFNVIIFISCSYIFGKLFKNLGKSAHYVKDRYLSGELDPFQFPFFVFILWNFFVLLVLLFYKPRVEAATGGVLRHFAKSTGEHLCQNLSKPATLLKKGSDTDFFLWILRKF